MSLYKTVGFVHTHVHSAYSLREGAIGVEALIKHAKADGQPAVAITDTNNLFSALEFAEKAAKSGIQPLIGAQITVDFGDFSHNLAQNFVQKSPLARANVVLLAQNERGYLNLCRLVSRLWLDPPEGEEAHLRYEALELEEAEGLIALTGGPTGALDRLLAAGAGDIAQARLKRLQAIFGDRLYIELQRHGQKSAVEPALLTLAYDNSLPIVASNEPYFVAASDFQAQDALLCIADGTLVSAQQRRRLTPEHRLKTRAEMLALFADLPEATDNSVEIALRCAFRPCTRSPILPRFSADNEEAELRRQSTAGLDRLLARYGPAPGKSVEDYHQRLAFELDVIVGMKFCGYFLIVADFIQWAKQQDIPVGPGRGSGTGSLTAYALTITDVDPLRFGLLFERFLNPERVSMPDFDVDFCQERRDEVIAYVRRRYGEDRVAQIITFGSFLARGVMRNVGRVLEIPLGQVDRLAKLIPQNPAKPISLQEALDSEPKLQEAAASDEKVAQMLVIAQKLEGLLSNASTHAAGVVIGDRPLVELVPLYKDPKSDMPATQFNMKWVEQAGLVKFDFLGLKTMTVLRYAQKRVERKGVKIDLGAIPLDDTLTYKMLERGETLGVFQLEGAGMTKALVSMHADRFEDIIALVALYRPGPMANIPSYCARKLGQEPVDYIHERVASALSETYGIIIYQEQVMQIAQILSGYSLGEADLLRRAMGKKIKSEMDAQRSRFVRGCCERGLEESRANDIFDSLAKFADYGFNKSHAAAYALISYWTAWFKANHAAEFLAASMSLDKSNTDKLAEFRNDAKRLNISVAPPNVNDSGVDFDVQRNKDGSAVILYALSAVKGVGESQAQAIVAARTAGGVFRSLQEFARRVDMRAVNKKALEALANAGAFDILEPERATVFAAIEALQALGQRHAEERQLGQAGLFGEAEEMPLMPLKIKATPWSVSERLKREHEAVGFFLSGHPLESYELVIKRLRAMYWAMFVAKARGGETIHRLAASVVEAQIKRTKAGKKMGIFQFSDPSGQYEAIAFEETLNAYRDLLEKGQNVLLTLNARLEGDDVRAQIVNVERLSDAATRNHKGLRIVISQEDPVAELAKRLRKGGDGDVFLVVQVGTRGEEIELKLPGRYAITGELAASLQAISGVLHVEHV